MFFNISVANFHKFLKNFNLSGYFYRSIPCCSCGMAGGLQLPIMSFEPLCLERKLREISPGIWLEGQTQKWRTWKEIKWFQINVFWTVEISNIKKKCFLGASILGHPLWNTLQEHVHSCHDFNFIRKTAIPEENLLPKAYSICYFSVLYFSGLQETNALIPLIKPVT